MKPFISASVAALLLAACGSGDPQSTGGNTNTASAGAPMVESSVAVKTPVYSAEAFFDTTSYRAASSTGFAFSPDGSKILISSDETGVYNAYSVDAQSAERHPLTTSDTNASYALCASTE